MSLNDPLANVMSQLNTEDRLGKKSITSNSSSKIILSVLNILKENNYIGEFKEIETTKGNAVEINLLNSINKCGVIKSRFSVEVENFKKYERRFLPAKGFGYLILTTSKGIMTQENALKNGIGGKLLAYVY